MVRGASVHYVAGDGHRPIPLATDQNRRTTHTPAKPKPRGLDWDALTPRCRDCGEKSGRLNRDDLCPTCAPAGTANLSVTPVGKTKKTDTSCSTCGRESRFLHDGRCPICAAETTPLVLDTPAPEIEPPAPQHAPELAPSSRAAVASDLAWPTRPERLWDILVATEDCSGDPIAAMMRRAAIASLEALWLHWRLHHEDPRTAPAPVEDGTEGSEPAGPRGKGKPATPGRPTKHRNWHPDSADREEVIRLYLEDRASTTSIGAIFGVERRTIRRILTEAGIAIRPPANVVAAPTQLTTEQIDTIANRYAAGESSLHKLAREHHIAAPRLRDILLDRGITIRSKGRGTAEITERLHAAGHTTADARAWAVTQGLIKPGGRGSLPAGVVTAYLNSRTTPTTTEGALLA